MPDAARRGPSTTVQWRLAEALQHLQARWKYRGKQRIVVVHQMGRVGSKTVRWAVRDHVPGVRSLHTHYLNPRTIERMHESFVRLYQHTGRPMLYREHLQSCWLARKIERRDYGDWKIISLIRDPVARTVSAFFRHLPLIHPELPGGFADDPANLARLVELFRGGDHFESGFALGWFDREVRDVFGVDVFERPFPADGLGCLYPCEAGGLLVLRTEDLASTGSRALGEFLGTPPIDLKHRNRSSERSYARVYDRFIAELRLPSAYLDRMYGSRLARHFYRDDEIAAFRERWTVDA